MTTRTMKTLIPVAGLATATAIALTSAAHAQDMKIGAIIPMTGDLQAYGETTLNGVRLAEKEINAAGGNITVVVGDTQTAPQSGVDAAQKLVSIEKVSGLVGALSSGVTIPIAQSVSAVVGVPQISGASTSPVITGLEDNDFLFRTVPSDAGQGAALAQVTSERGIEAAAIMYVNNDYGKGLADAFQAAFEAMGGTVTQSVGFEKNQASYRGELKAAADGDAEHLVLIAYPESGQTILRQSLEGGLFGKFIFTDGLKAPELVEALGAEYLNGTFGTTAKALETEGGKHFQDAWKAEYGATSEKPYHDTAYDAVHLLSLAALKAGSTDPVAVRDALRDVANPPGEKVGPGQFAKAMELLAAGTDIDYEGAAGSQNFDTHGDVAGTFELWEIQDGQFETITVFEPKAM
ncbi:ABC transporter substrate-binding protein [Roseospira visakhapatnamensis]|uniref:ABC-type branched-subunit amino acid transport system substrate-binding protein n=1 Tax=Roseospira visakhapatnamensis TaxID=390880 RepID=A0A7W6RBF3_9PROT|nr:ABC transporter substrate-binding protein [Roseospira visakhapatnamensis]MBB4264839.1 ABC-type branched-subunit amino acid transport system substrate-binding protein [Roseospira visakhapatnamensis]